MALCMNEAVVPICSFKGDGLRRRKRRKRRRRRRSRRRRRRRRAGDELKGKVRERPGEVDKIGKNSTRSRRERKK